MSESGLTWLDSSVVLVPQLERHWYALYTRSSHEKRVAEHLDVRQIEFFLPQYHETHRWKNRCNKRVSLPLFPGYIFARIAPTERVKVLEVPSVVSLVGAGQTALPLPDELIELLRTGLESRKAKPHPYLVVGQKARICRGPLAGMVGVVVRKDRTLRVVLTLDLIMRSISVEVDGDDLEPLIEPRNSN